MKLWRWFCRLGDGRMAYRKKVKEFRPVAKEITQSGVDVCSRVCGHDGCRCGGTMKGLYCIWSYYRME